MFFFFCNRRYTNSRDDDDDDVSSNYVDRHRRVISKPSQGRGYILPARRYTPPKASIYQTSYVPRRYE